MAAMDAGAKAEIGPILADLEEKAGRADRAGREELIAVTGRSLAAMGERVVPKLKKRLDGKQVYASSACAHALAKLDPAGLAKELLRQHKTSKGKVLVFEVALRELVEAPASAEIDRLYEVQLPSMPDLAVEGLSKRLDTDRFVDSLFTHMARRAKYDPEEVMLYSMALYRKGKTAGAVARRLERELKAARGRPGKVFWLLKLLAIEELGGKGGPEATKTLKKFLRDKSAYMNVRTRYDARSGAELDSSGSTKTFAELARKALEQIEARQKKR
jgi:HEAT repeat protein